MKAVFSYWSTTDNSLISATNWLNPKYQLYSWVIAVHQAKKWFKKVEIVTDSKALPIFQKLQLPYTGIDTNLDELIDYDKKFWALGKIKAYQIQNEPFVHIDNDVLLLGNALDGFLDKPLVCQNIEDGQVFKDFYEPMVNLLEENKVNVYDTEGAMQFWRLTEKSPCMAIYLCNDLEFNKAYCRTAFKFVNDNLELLSMAERNQLTAKEKDTGREVPLCYSVIFEQYLAGQVAKQTGKKFTPMCEEDKFADLEKLGYVHIWGAKKNEQWFENIEKIVKRDYPLQYEIIQNLIKDAK